MEKKKKLTAPEIANLWTQYITDSMAICVNRYLLSTCQDKELAEILKKSVGLSKSHMDKVSTFMKNENFPVPKGFSEEDVNLKASPLFTDNIMYIYMQIMTLHGLNSYTLCLTTAIRKDIRQYFTEVSNQTTTLYNQIIDQMVQKGIISDPPIINSSQSVEFIKDKDYLGGWFDKKRPLNGVEISGIYYNMQKTIVKVILQLGFSQAVRSKEIRKYLQQGVKICENQLGEMGKTLAKDHLSTPMSWQGEVTNSTDAPFSDKLMLFHVVSLAGVAAGYYGAALSAAQRKDLVLMYSKMIAEIALYAEDGINLLIKNGWLEEPPTAADRKALAEKKGN